MPMGNMSSLQLQSVTLTFILTTGQHIVSPLWKFCVTLTFKLIIQFLYAMSLLNDSHGPDMLF